MDTIQTVPADILPQILKYCATPKSAPSPPLREKEIYCLSSFTGRAEQWYKEEIARQLNLQTSRATRTRSSSSRRIQPSRSAKGNKDQQPPSTTRSYSLAKYEFDYFVRSAARPENEDTTSLSPSHTICTPDTITKDFKTRLNRAIEAKVHKLKTHCEPWKRGHVCKVVFREWDCDDQEYCGHGLVEKALKWVPKKPELLRMYMKTEMEGYFSSRQGNNSAEKLRELKKNRGSKLKELVLQKVEDREARMDSQVPEAVMVTSPSLGRWPEKLLPEDDVDIQSVEFGGLKFSVDICLGDVKIEML